MSVVESFIHQDIEFEGVLLCGDHGDPIYHPQFHEFLLRLTQLKNQPPIYIATNGSHRSKEWWKTTCSLLRPQDTVIFGIDGLKDTSKIYRIHSDWEGATEAMKMIKATTKAKVHWQWILFKHNQHQLAEAKKLSQDWGVDSFIIIKSFRSKESEMWAPTITIKEANEIFKNTTAL